MRRRTRAPYAVWVSEIMLQQTQVDTVIPYYRRFLRTFPTLQRLAAAPLERVLELWSGLGYYRRARHLHLAARQVMREFGGRFPSEYALARTLPGVGDYTARAILSIAYNQPYSVMDGNVARVIARLLGWRGNFHRPAFRRAVICELDPMLARRSPGDFNQALMELGQSVCLPRAPRCPLCPLRKWCRAFAHGDPERYPAPRPRRSTELRHLATAVIVRPARTRQLRRGTAKAQTIPRELALVRGLDEGLLPDLWNFPAAFGSSRAEALARLNAKLEQTAPHSILWTEDTDGAGRIPLASLRHNITYRAILVDVYPAQTRDGHASDTLGPLRWFPAAKLSRAAVSELTRKIADLPGVGASAPT
jgi:A/G-specific adenine glycosylase